MLVFVYRMHDIEKVYFYTVHIKFEEHVSILYQYFSSIITQYRNDSSITVTLLVLLLSYSVPGVALVYPPCVLASEVHFVGSVRRFSSLRSMFAIQIIYR